MPSSPLSRPPQNANADNDISDSTNNDTPVPSSQTTEPDLLQNSMSSLKLSEPPLAERLEQLTHDIPLPVQNQYNLANKFRTLLEKNEKLQKKLAKADRQYQSLKAKATRLSQSDRRKAKVHQRNLSLKSALNNTIKKMKRNAGNNNNNKSAAQEALIAANERIRELEGTGRELLRAMEEHLDKTDDEDEEESGRDTALYMTIAEVKFQNVLDDEAFGELRKTWGDLLKEE